MENIKESRTIPVFSLKLAGQLMATGYNLLSMSPNATRPDKNVFYFRSSDEINEEIAKYTSSRKPTQA